MLNWTPSALVSSNSAADLSSSSDIGRVTIMPVVTSDPTTVPLVNPNIPNSTDTTAPNPVYQSGSGVTVPSTSVAAAKSTGIAQPFGYKFNLPPHSMSLPLRPAQVDPYVVGQLGYQSFHGLRRGRIWYWAGSNKISPPLNSSTGLPSTTSTPAATDVIDTNWGFQFLWNPTTISTSVSRNMDITPSSADALRVVAGVFPGQETLTLNIVIDRTNDFAAVKAATSSAQAPVDLYLGTYAGTGSAELGQFETYYKANYPGADITSENFSDKLNKLMSQGTMADLEYLFKAVNGGGSGNLTWTNLLGKQTANVGYLSPTLMGIQLGPTLDSLSYVGWISNLSLEHTAFTENMIPLRTDVSISIQCFSGSGLQSGASA